MASQWYDEIPTAYSASGNTMSGPVRDLANSNVLRTETTDFERTHSAADSLPASTSPPAIDVVINGVYSVDPGISLPQREKDYPHRFHVDLSPEQSGLFLIQRFGEFAMLIAVFEKPKLSGVKFLDLGKRSADAGDSPADFQTGYDMIKAADAAAAASLTGSDHVAGAVNSAALFEESISQAIESLWSGSPASPATSALSSLTVRGSDVSDVSSEIESDGDFLSLNDESESVLASSLTCEMGSIDLTDDEYRTCASAGNAGIATGGHETTERFMPDLRLVDPMFGRYDAPMTAVRNFNHGVHNPPRGANPDLVPIHPFYGTAGRSADKFARNTAGESSQPMHASDHNLVPIRPFYSTPGRPAEGCARDMAVESPRQVQVPDYTFHAPRASFSSTESVDMLLRKAAEPREGALPSLRRLSAPGTAQDLFKEGRKENSVDDEPVVVERPPVPDCWRAIAVLWPRS